MRKKESNERVIYKKEKIMNQEKIKLLEYLKFDLLPRLRDKRDIDYVKKQIEKLMKEIENAKNI